MEVVGSLHRPRRRAASSKPQAGKLKSNLPNGLDGVAEPSAVAAVVRHLNTHVNAVPLKLKPCQCEKCPYTAPCKINLRQYQMALLFIRYEVFDTFANSVV